MITSTYILIVLLFTTGGMSVAIGGFSAEFYSQKLCLEAAAAVKEDTQLVRSARCYRKGGV